MRQLVYFKSTFFSLPHLQEFVSFYGINKPYRVSRVTGKLKEEQEE